MTSWSADEESGLTCSKQAYDGHVRESKLASFPLVFLEMQFQCAIKPVEGLSCLGHGF